MAGSAIFRADKLSQGGAARMLGHALRAHQIHNAVDGGRAPVVLAGCTSPAASHARMLALKSRAIGAGQRWRKDQVTAIDMLFTYTPQALDLKRDQDAFFDKCIEFVKAEWPTCEILTAAIHRDESTPHMQLIMAPIDARGHFAAKTLMGGPGDMQKRQDRYWRACGAPFNLSRGIPGSKAKHIPIKTFYGHAALVESGHAEELEKVPQPLTMTFTNVITGKYSKQKTAREKILERNAARIQQTNLKLRQLRALHPKMIERQADKYRQAKHLADIAARDKSAAALMLSKAEYHETMSRESEKRAKNLDAKSQAVLIDKLSKNLAPPFVATLARRLGIELQPGKGLCDQVRRAGLALTLLDAAQLIDKASDGEINRAAQAQRQKQPRGDIDRDRGPEL